MTYFNIKQDVKIERAGGFWCEACLTGKPAAEQSPDPRYCQNCFTFLLDEATLLPARRKSPKWVPIKSILRPLALSVPRQAVTKLSDKGVGGVWGLQSTLAGAH